MIRSEKDHPEIVRRPEGDAAAEGMTGPSRQEGGRRRESELPLSPLPERELRQPLGNPRGIPRS